VRRLLVVLALVAGTAGCGGGGTTTVTVTQTVTRHETVTVTTSAAGQAAPPCAAAALTGTFSVIPGSPGAGQISYRLRLVNASSEPCSVSGIPAMQLLDEQGARLPTNVSPAHPGETEQPVVVEPGAAASADARFSPDVPGGSEPTDAPCEPRAFTLVVTIGDGSVVAAVRPPTPVCERGSLSFSNLAG
jgi:hypothetical protein